MIQHIFFDLDRTLWDFEKNTELTLRDMYAHFQLEQIFKSFAVFSKSYHKINDKFWKAYRKGEIEKSYLIDNRFTDTLKAFSIDDNRKGKEMGDYYIERSPYQSALFPSTREVLTELKKDYHLHIITNGFKEVQHIKLNYCKLNDFFETVVCSDEVGVNKPNPRVFNFALQGANAKPEESIMIGDDLFADVGGAERIGMKGILFDPQNKAKPYHSTVKVKCLNEIPGIISFC